MIDIAGERDREKCIYYSLATMGEKENFPLRLLCGDVAQVVNFNVYKRVGMTVIE